MAAAKGLDERIGRRAFTCVLMVVLLSPALLVGCEDEGDKTQKITIKGKEYELELALTSNQRYQGLSDRKAIADDGGMLFVFQDASVLSFVMRKCLVPIDIIYLSPNGRIVAMHEMQVQPYNTDESDLKSYSSVYPAQFAIELKAGSIKALGLKEGDKIELTLEELKKRAR